MNSPACSLLPPRVSPRTPHGHLKLTVYQRTSLLPHGRSVLATIFQLSIPDPVLAFMLPCQGAVPETTLTSGAKCNFGGPQDHRQI